MATLPLTDIERIFPMLDQSSISTPTQQLQLTQGLSTTVDELDYDWLCQWSWCVSKAGYAVRGERRDGHNHLVLLHREIATRMGVVIPQGWYVDHANHDTLDNRRINLRLASPTQSAYNVRKTNRHGYRGVIYTPHCFKGAKQYDRKKPWQARIRIAGRKRHLSLGYYATAIEAAQAYDTAARHYHGEFAVLNFSEKG